MTGGRRTITAGLLAVLATGCAGAARPSPVPAGRPAVAASNRPPSAPIGVGPNTVTMLHGGAVTFRVLGALIDSARSSVHLEMYEFGRQDMVDALLRAQSRSVVVTVIVDPTVDVTAATASLLRAHGINVLAYPVRKMMIDHVKLLVVDSAVAVVGGINWGVGSEFNHDVDAVIRGPAATNLQRVFARDLVTCGEMVAVPDPVTDPSITVATTLPGADIRPLIISAIEHAGRHLDLELYVLTDQGIVSALIAARGRGVAVRLLIDPDQRSSDPSSARLRAAGVDLRRYRGSGEKLHAKLMVADGETVIFGSANWSAGGFARNHEIEIALPSSVAVAADVETAINADWRAAA